MSSRNAAKINSVNFDTTRTYEDITQELNSIKDSVWDCIRVKCLDCSNFQIGLVYDCKIKDCGLYPVRMLKDPYLKKRELTEQQKQACREKLKLARQPKH